MASSITGIVVGTQRHGHTANGNPMMSVTLSTPTQGFPGTACLRISNDSALVYEIDNAVFRDQPHTFELTKHGRITGEVHPLQLGKFEHMFSPAYPLTCTSVRGYV